MSDDPSECDDYNKKGGFFGNFPIWNFINSVIIALVTAYLGYFFWNYKHNLNEVTEMKKLFKEFYVRSNQAISTYSEAVFAKKTTLRLMEDNHIKKTKQLTRLAKKNNNFDQEFLNSLIRYNKFIKKQTIKNKQNLKEFNHDLQKLVSTTVLLESKFKDQISPLNIENNLEKVFSLKIKASIPKNKNYCTLFDSRDSLNQKINKLFNWRNRKIRDYFKQIKKYERKYANDLPLIPFT